MVKSMRKAYERVNGCMKLLKLKIVNCEVVVNGSKGKISEKEAKKNNKQMESYIL